MSSQDLDHLPVTEEENPRTANLSFLSSPEIVSAMNDEDARVADAVREVLPAIAKAVDDIVDRLRASGRLFYIGTGTSGRLGVLDAAECPPTFGVKPELVQAVIAGGYEACHRAVEASEDDAEAGKDGLRVNRSLRIPLDELEWRFTASGGPGGQHANRSNTKAEVRFDVASSPSLQSCR